MKKNILFVMHLPPPIHGASMMGKNIRDSEYINNEFNCHYINLATARSLNDIGKFRIGKVFDFVILLFEIVIKVIKIKPNLVYITPNACGKAFYKDFVIVTLIKILGCKIIVHYHNKGVANRQNKAIDNLLYRYFFKNIKVILLAESLYKDIQKYVEKKNVYICPNGIQNNSAISKNTHSEFNILFLSNMMIEKGVYTLLDACKKIKDDGIRFHCNYVGKWSDITEENFNNCITMYNLSDCVTAYGAKYGDEKNVFLSITDVFVFPTYYSNECFPLVLLEAMQQKITCISSDEGAIPNIIDDGNTGFIVHKKNVNELVQKIEYLYNNPGENKMMGEKGYKKYLENYTLETFEHNFTDILVNEIS